MKVVRVDGILEPTKSNAEVSEPSKRESFWEALKDRIEEVDAFQKAADRAMEKGAIQGAEDIHEAMIRLQEAEISLRLFIEVRNKALEAYREIMRMQF
ncbi:flagellar hook-basal body complex protein FliE [Thermodesulforhabdus norvegica]|uniref:Flagellar hook-basal body complex protein FliE n=1 Tax=Thermodesulforhabdus norvegica TaxID=39841 RepID=A0A1I4R727_9BACT|nr:flagellar hook-basal body complex protein FliE [Thermodesulforhabdus norvegica]SFM47806.1 flagellar hook-basal body complex protein FliE [Thermodesulforhabdus norvegica]